MSRLSTLPKKKIEEKENTNETKIQRKKTKVYADNELDEMLEDFEIEPVVKKVKNYIYKLQKLLILIYFI
jgi:hypothetical protein